MANDKTPQHYTFPTEATSPTEVGSGYVNDEPIDQSWSPDGAHKPAMVGERHYDPTIQSREYEFLLDDVLNIREVEGKVKGYENIDANFAKVREFEAMANAMHDVSQKGDRDPVQMKVVDDTPGARHIETYLPPYIGGPDGLHQQYADGGWSGVSSDPAYGDGQGLPHAFMGAVSEMSMSANPGYSVLELLSKGVIAALEAKGSEELKKEWLPRLNNGSFSGAMVMTEQKYGSSLKDVETTFQLGEDGQTGKVYGHKRYLSSADHDATLGENGERQIVHTVMARTANSDGYLMGTAKIDGEVKDVLLNNDGFVLQTNEKGEVQKDEQGNSIATEKQGRPQLSLVLVPRVLLDKEGNYVDADGNKVDEPNTNNVRATKLNDKMGLEVQSNTDAAYDGSQGYLIGEVGKGQQNMFVIMNEARLGVGLQGTGIAEIARQNVEEYAQNRVQGPGGAILNYPRVQERVLDIRAHVDAGRSIAAQVGLEFDKSLKGKDEFYSAEEKQEIQNYVDVMTPMVKWGLTEYGEKAVGEAQQVFAGAGYMRQWGVAQLRSDVIISKIYEGENGLLAVALAGTQLEKMPSFINVVKKDLEKAQGAGSDITGPLEETLKTFQEATDWMMAAGAQAKFAKNPQAAEIFQAAAWEYAELMYSVAAGTALAKNAAVAEKKLQNPDISSDDKAFLESKVANAKYYAQNVLKHEPAMRFGKMQDNTAALELPDLNIQKDEKALTEVKQGAIAETVGQIRAGREASAGQQR